MYLIYKHSYPECDVCINESWEMEPFETLEEANKMAKELQEFYADEGWAGHYLYKSRFYAEEGTEQDLQYYCCWLELDAAEGRCMGDSWD